MILKFLTSAYDTLEALQVRNEFLKFPTFVPNATKALQDLAEFFASLNVVSDFPGTSVIYR